MRAKGRTECADDILRRERLYRNIEQWASVVRKGLNRRAEWQLERPSSELSGSGCADLRVSQCYYQQLRYRETRGVAMYRMIKFTFTGMGLFAEDK